MKKIILLIFVVTLSVSCNTEEKVTISDLDTSTPVLTELDVWLRDNFVVPYNIDVQYEWDDDEVDFNRFLFPPKVERVKQAMEAVKTIWLDSYSQVGGEDFVKIIAPRSIVLVGGFNLNPSGTITLGFAEGGKKIVFFNVDTIDYSDRDSNNLGSIMQFLSTIQHEYVHILNQTIPFDEPTYSQITPGNYTAQWYNETIPGSRELGYITAYARSNPFEDFAEMVNIMLSNDKSSYDAIIEGITSDEAKQNLRIKEAFVVDYYKKEFNIDLYELQAVVAANVDKVIVP
ncbi:substrate import-associated zinc metallohydrolase lipoprotein [Tenacibaculum sp. C7A-26P2]|uniref:substrate import-associated zinc metallohydrolase lipoprotein n=1 Tax=Tenacibaculum sp. C7A-26P2 TaxID=3447504 RepID=UPI003F85183A